MRGSTVPAFAQKVRKIADVSTPFVGRVSGVVAGQR